jgi:hypothetical protein
MRAPARRTHWSAALWLIALLVGGCAPVGIAEDWRIGMVKVYNRTLSVISFEHGWVPICSDNAWFLPDWTPAPTVATPTGAVNVEIDPGVPADFRGVVSVIVSDNGVNVVRGDPGELPKCAGLPPP